jgi:glucosylceramidase
MKTNDSMDGGLLRPDAEPAFAAYLTRSVQAYQSAGIPVKFLTIQNEPLYETKNYPGTLLPSDQAARIIGSYLGPDLRKAGLPTKVLAYDHNWDHSEYPLAVLADPKAFPFLAGSALHCYGGDVAAQDAIHAAYQDKGIWMTECSGGTWDKEPALMKTTRLLIGATRYWAKAVVLWGLALDSDHGPHDGGCDKCRPLVEINLKDKQPSVTYTGDFYGLGHASRFVYPGATRIASDTFANQGLETVAFQNVDGSIALVVLNHGSAAASFAVQWHGKTFRAALHALAVATYTWSPR